VVSAGTANPPTARVNIVATPSGGTGRSTAVDVTRPGRDGHTFFGAVVMDHEGPYGIDVRVTGPSGEAAIHSNVDATYDLRPSPLMAALYLLPFVLVGAVWMRLLIRRSKFAKAARADAPHDGTTAMDGARLSRPSLVEDGTETNHE
jgi:hypothetical protein